MEATELRRIRKALGLNQARFGGLAGVGRQTVSDWECGRGPIPTGAVVLARILSTYPALLPAALAFAGLGQPAGRVELFTY